MQEGHIYPGSEHHTGQALLPASAPQVGMGEKCTDGAGGGTALPTNWHLVGRRRRFLSSQDISSPQEPTHRLDKDRGLIKEL